jgi:O-antigen ligase
VKSLAPKRESGPGIPDRLNDLARSFTAGPAAIPALVVIVIVIVWAAGEAGQPPLHWYPGALVILGLLVLAATTLPLRLREIPKPVLIAGAFLLAFTLWSFLSITWADAKGTAWDGANRTLLYLAVFVLFGLWRQRAGAATALVVLWTLAMAVVAGVTLIQIAGSSGVDLFAAGRLKQPAGYANSVAAMFLMPAWAALVLAGRRELGAPLRAVLAGATTLLGGVALMALSRGAVFSTPFMLILLFAVVPGRARNFVVLVPVAVGLAAVTPTVLDANDKLRHHRAGDALGSLAPTILLATLGVALVVGLVAVLEGRVRNAETRAKVRRGVSVIAAATLVVVLVAGLVVGGNPFSRLSDGWDSFKKNYSDNPGQPLSQGLGSGRYDYYRVSLDLFNAHPLQGVGADNFQQDYLAVRRTDQTPRYPHSLEMRTLSQTGIVGTLLLIGFIAAALTAAALAIRRGSPLGKAVAAACTLSFAYWLIHGSFDWFWEFAGLGVPAVAMIGLACGLSPRAVAPTSVDEARPLLPRIVAVAVLVIAVMSMALPWLSDVSTQYAADHWRADPKAAYDRLDRAASLDRLSPEPYLAAATIALKRSESARARADFLKALERQPRSDYATLELGALASSYGDRAAAERYLARTVRLNPQGLLARKALTDVRAGRQVSIQALNAAILNRVRAIERGG